MKVTPEHVEEIRQGIESFFSLMAGKGHSRKAIEDRYRARDIPRGNAVIDIDRRYRWDLYYAAARHVGGLPDSTNGYNDAHIYTALKSIVPTINKEK